MDRIIDQARLAIQWNPASLVFFLAAAVSAWLVVLAWGRRNEPSGPPLISLLIFEGLWALCEAIEAVLIDPSAQAVIYGLKLSSVALVPPSLLFFVLEYTSRTGAVPPQFKVLILAVPAISIGLIVTSGEHRLFLAGAEQVEIQGYRLLHRTYGPAFWVHTSYCYAVLCLSAWLLARSALALGGVLRKQMLFLSACLLIPLVINVADLFKVIPLPYREYDLTAATFVVTGVLGLVLLRRFQLINIAPVSYSLVVQEMLDAIIVVDSWGRIVGVNRAALRLVGRVDRDLIGLAADVLPSWLRIPEHLARLEAAAELSYRLSTDSRDPGFTYDVRVSRFPHGRVPGWLVIIRDISALSGAEAERTARIAAEQANWAKDAFLAKLSHELRTPLTPVLAITSATLDQTSIPAGIEVRPRDRAEECSSGGALDRRPSGAELDHAGQAKLADGARRCARASAPELGELRPIYPGCRPDRRPRSIRDEQPDRRRSGPTPASLLEPDRERRAVLSRSQSLDDPHAEHYGGRPRDRIPGRRSRPRVVAVGADLQALHPGESGRCRTRSGPRPGPVDRPVDRRIARGLHRRGEPGDRTRGHVPSRSPHRRFHRSRDHGSTDRRQARPSQEAAVVVPEEARESTRPTTILLVEDNPDSLSALAKSLSLLGYLVRPANSLRTALVAAAHEGYDLIVSDLELGDGTGVELLSSLGPLRSVPAIALTGYGSEEDRKMCLEAGFLMHIVKPVQTRQLSEAIRSVIQKQSAKAN